MISLVEENYLKALLHLTFVEAVVKPKKIGVGTNELASFLEVKPSSVNEMLKKLKEKDLVFYEKYKKITLTPLGESNALKIVRKHRLWETFLCEKLDFNWDEVHEVAEQLEHIKSEKLIEKLDKFLDFPNYDPHGDPIPNKNGVLPIRETKRLNRLSENEKCVVLAVSDTSSLFLNFLEDLNIEIGTKITLIEKIAYDGSVKIELHNKTISLSKKAAENILVG